MRRISGSVMRKAAVDFRFIAVRKLARLVTPLVPVTRFG
jgi:hypothetical protein